MAGPKVLTRWWGTLHDHDGTKVPCRSVPVALLAAARGGRWYRHRL